VKFYHKSLKNPLFKRPSVWHYFQFCVLRAWWSDEPTSTAVSGEVVVLNKGQFVSTLRGDSKRTGLSIQQIRTSRRILEKSGNLTLKVTPNYTLINVVKYPEYQDRKTGSQHANQHTANTRPTHGQHINKKVKKVKDGLIIKKATGVGDFKGRKNALSPEAQAFKKLLEKRSKDEKAQSQGG